MFILNGREKKVLKTLKSCGLTEYESEAYFTLLLAGRSRVWDIYKKSSVPNAKLYRTIDKLKEKRLVDVEGWMPKMVSPKNFESYIKKTVRRKQKEIDSLYEAGEEIDRTVSSLKPVAKRFKKYKVFEPKHRRR